MYRWLVAAGLLGALVFGAYAPVISDKDYIFRASPNSETCFLTKDRSTVYSFVKGKIGHDKSANSLLANGDVNDRLVRIYDEDIFGFGLGTGFEVSPGLVLTNKHVVASIPKLSVSGLHPYVKGYGEVVKTDSTNDLALVRTYRSDKKDEVLTFGNPDSTRIKRSIRNNGTFVVKALSTGDIYYQYEEFDLTRLDHGTESAFKKRYKLKSPEFKLFAYNPELEDGTSGSPIIDAEDGGLVGIIRAVAPVEEPEVNVAVSNTQIAKFLGDFCTQ